MDKNKETFETWNNVATLYHKRFMHLDLYNDTYNRFCDAISIQNAKILDIACGPGNITKYLLSQRPDFDILGIDIAPNMIELAKKNNPIASFAMMDSREIGSLTAKYDGIICGFCLPYLSETETRSLIFDSYNLLNENGCIYLSFVEGNLSRSGFKTGAAGRVFFYYHNLNNLKKELAAAKFSEMQTFKVKYQKTETDFETHTILIARKLNS